MGEGVSMGNSLYWYVLFVRTGAEERLADKLREFLDGDKHKPFVLKGEKFRRRQGEKTAFQTTCFPGYLFIESCEPPSEFIKSINPLIRKIEGLYKLLSGSDESSIAVCEEEKRVLQAVFGDNHCIEVPTLLKEGDTVKVISGSLAGHESKIIKANRNGLIIHFEMFGKFVEVHLGVDIVRKVD
jgi:transcriptional antiterminator NusG